MPDSTITPHNPQGTIEKSSRKTKANAGISRIVPLKREKTLGLPLDLVREFQPMCIPAEIRTSKMDNEDIT